MSKPISVGFTYGTVTTSLLLSQLDTNFGSAFGAINDFATYGNYLVDSSGTPNQITCTIPAGTTFSYSTGVPLQVQIANTNTSTAVNINVSLLGNKAVLNIDGSLPAVGQLIAGMILQLQYNGTAFLMTGATSKPAGGVTSISGTANQIAASASTGAVTLSFPSNIIISNTVTAASLAATNLTLSGAGQGIFGSSVASAFAWQFTETAAAGTNFGMLISAGTNASDISFRAANSGGTPLLTVSGSGNVTIAAPSSGVALTVNGSAVALQVNGAAGQNTGIFSASTTAGNGFGVVITAGTNSSDYALRVLSASSVTEYARIYGDGGMTLGAPTGGNKGLGTFNAQEIYRQGSLIVQTGTFTGTLTGCTTAPTATFTYTIINNAMAIVECVAGLQATSNANTCTVTGMPAFLNAARAVNLPVSLFINAGASNPGTAVNPSGGVMTFLTPVGVGFSSTGFTTSLPKGIGVGSSWTYSLV